MKHNFRGKNKSNMEHTSREGKVTCQLNCHGGSKQILVKQDKTSADTGQFQL